MKGSLTHKAMAQHGRSFPTHVTPWVVLSLDRHFLRLLSAACGCMIQVWHVESANHTFEYTKSYTIHMRKTVRCLDHNGDSSWFIQLWFKHGSKLSAWPLTVDCVVFALAHKVISYLWWLWPPSLWVISKNGNDWPSGYKGSSCGQTWILW